MSSGLQIWRVWKQIWGKFCLPIFLLPALPISESVQLLKATSPPVQRQLGFSRRGNFVFHQQENSAHPLPCCLSDHSSSSISVITSSARGEALGLAGVGRIGVRNSDVPAVTGQPGEVCALLVELLGAALSPPRVSRAARQRHRAAAISHPQPFLGD